MRVDINSIRIQKKRIRKKAENIQELAESIKLHGLIEPIILDQDNNLIAGYRRLQAVRLLGYQSIEARVIKIQNSYMALKLEIEENLNRMNFSIEELAEANKRLHALEKGKFNLSYLLKRIIAWIKKFLRR